jgi:hypothetical protein
MTGIQFHYRSCISSQLAVMFHRSELLLNIYCRILSYLKTYVKKKLKVARRGLYSTAALYIADCALAPNVVPSFISRGATIPSDVGALY